MSASPAMTPPILEESGLPRTLCCTWKCCVWEPDQPLFQAWRPRAATRAWANEQNPISYPTHHAHQWPALRKTALTFRSRHSDQSSSSFLPLCPEPYPHIFAFPAPFANTQCSLNVWHWRPVLLERSNKPRMTHHFSGPVQLIICSKIRLKVTKPISALSELLNGKRVSHEGVGLPRPLRNGHGRWEQPLAPPQSWIPKSRAHPYQEIIDLIIGELGGRCQKHLNSLHFQFMKPIVAWYYGFIRFVHLAGNLLL